ncbi:Uncharacterised protein [Mycobacteroides abscessus subsp. abscessus]|nr:Uncharacterised protein [Mycobacteroides abscessus subsp. abscessus]
MSTVSCESLLLVPMTPTGPRLIQPTTYSLSRPCMRPASLRITPRRESNGNPGTGTPRYPMARTTRCVGSVCLSPVSWATTYPSSSTSLLRPTVIDSTTPAPSPCSSMGEVRNRNTTLRWPSVCGRSENLRKVSMLVRVGLGAAASCSSVISARSSGSTTTSTPGSSPISRSSSGVKVACSGPRRPMITTSRIALWSKESSARSAMSVVCSDFGSIPRMRATSSATLPLPTTTARSPDRSTDTFW